MSSPSNQHTSAARKGPIQLSDCFFAINKTFVNISIPTYQGQEISDVRQQEKKWHHPWCFHSKSSTISSSLHLCSDIILFLDILVLAPWRHCGDCWERRELAHRGCTISANSHSPLVHDTVGQEPESTPAAIRRELSMGCGCFHCIASCFGAVSIYLSWQLAFLMLYLLV